MEAIKINMNKIQNANYDLPPLISNLSEQIRYINLLKWRIQPGIQDRKYIRERLHSIVQELDRAEQMLRDIYEMAGSAVEKYKNIDTKLTTAASKFQ